VARQTLARLVDVAGGAGRVAAEAEACDSREAWSTGCAGEVVQREEQAAGTAEAEVRSRRTGRAGLRAGPAQPVARGPEVARPADHAVVAVSSQGEAGLAGQTAASAVRIGRAVAETGAAVALIRHEEASSVARGTRRVQGVQVAAGSAGEAGSRCPCAHGAAFSTPRAVVGGWMDEPAGFAVCRAAVVAEVQVLADARETEVFAVHAGAAEGTAGTAVACRRVHEAAAAHETAGAPAGSLHQEVARSALFALQRATRAASAVRVALPAAAARCGGVAWATGGPAAAVMGREEVAGCAGDALEGVALEVALSADRAAAVLGRQRAGQAADAVGARSDARGAVRVAEVDSVRGRVEVVAGCERCEDVH